ncbi:MAG: helix-turn-helix transcriptional regulator [Eggerthellaceae bacterium]|nr:helix-turn-helix transcriptional regulator [Eggerthellaceae bacterium]
MLNDEALGAAEVAQLLHRGRNAVYEMARTGELPSYRIGRKLLFAREDVSAYLDAARRGGRPDPGEGGDVPDGDAPGWQLARSGFVLGGTALAADVLVDRVASAGTPVERVSATSYGALCALYGQRAEAAVVHLYDRRTNSYNIPFVQRLVPGIPVVVFRLLRRHQGLAVAQGNPCALASWGALMREGVRLANRSRGSGSRVLLDEKLLSMETPRHAIDGYDRAYASDLLAANAVAAGLADVAVVGEQAPAQVEGVDFVPLQQESLDLVVVKRPSTRPLIAAVREALGDMAFRSEFARIVHGDTTELGAIVYEC